MSCPACEHDLRPAARFCDACGKPVGGAAPAPRTPQAPSHLAEKILAARRRVEGERKQVTVLFADVKGSMELAERVDPEAWHRILDRFFARDESYRNIGDALDLPAGTIASRISRCLVKLRSELEGRKPASAESGA